MQSTFYKFFAFLLLIFYSGFVILSDVTLPYWIEYVVVIKGQSLSSGALVGAGISVFISSLEVLS